MTQQRTYEWHKRRLGKLTASEFGRLHTQNGRVSYAKKIREELALLKDIEAGVQVALGAGFTSKQTDWGMKHEPLARAEYELRHDYDLSVPGFVLHPKHDFVGCTPDGIVLFMFGGVEFKCPWDSAIHLHTVASKMIPPQYAAQMQGQMWICGLDWVDFVTFDPRMDLARRYFEIRTHRDERYINRLETQILETWDIVMEKPSAKQDNQGIPSIF